jgi:hypothetical protein
MRSRLSGKAMARTGLRMMPTFPLPPLKLSGRTMALCGLRMMPRFPSPSLKFRTVSFPQSGFKAGISDAAFPVPGLPSPFVLSATIEYSPLCVGGRCAYKHLRASGSPALPQGPSLRSGLCCPGPSSLNRPHPPHSQAHPDFVALRLIRDAIAVRLNHGA